MFLDFSYLRNNKVLINYRNTQLLFLPLIYPVVYYLFIIHTINNNMGVSLKK